MIMRERKFLNRQVIAWAFYDWGNSAFALSVLAVLFPLFLGIYWSAGDPGTAVTARLTWATAIASVIVSVIAPVIGAVADSGGFRKRFLFIFATLGAISTAALNVIDEGGWLPALGLYIFASVGYYSANVFYDSLIVDVCRPRYYSLVSSLGHAIGYFGGAILLSLHVWMLYTPQTFGFDDTNEVVRFAFITVGIWWLIFMTPLLFIVHESKYLRARSGSTVRAAYQALSETFHKIRNYRNVTLFLTAYWFFIGGLFTVIFMAVNFGQRLGFSSQDLVTALLITNFVGFPATLAYGYLGHRFGPKHTIYLGLGVYIIIVCWAVFLKDVRQFYAMSIIIGMVQGGVQGMSRSLYASLIPEQHAGEFFGFYNMVTKFSHILGPVLVGIVAWISDEPKFILVVLLPMFVIGALMLMRVDTTDMRAD
ncbi:MAG: MFS transporter [Gammaproteobacteria bacterium]|nr:MAG: MFS transporter [Gammaproteobacteria bacterium]